MTPLSDARERRLLAEHPEVLSVATTKGTLVGGRAHGA